MCVCVHIHTHTVHIYIYKRKKVKYIFSFMSFVSAFGLRCGRKRKTMKLSRDLSNLVVFTNSVVSQECLDEGERVKQSVLSSSSHTSSKSALLLHLLQELQETFCPLVRPELSLWSITKPNGSWFLTRGSCRASIRRPIASTPRISTLSFTGTSAVSWVRGGQEVICCSLPLRSSSV